MRVIETIAEFRQAHAQATRPLGLVPTMGFLHAGHMALVDRARDECATVAASIFVNPAQFGPGEDFAAYPRSMEADLAKLEVGGVDIVFAPPVEEVYTPGFATSVDVGDIGCRLEGTQRPGHFSGVATVVAKLLAIVRPDVAYFGQKDAQQYLVIKRMNADLNLGAEIVAVPTVREPDGLALSSRNVYLEPAERQAAPLLHMSLLFAKRLYEDGATDAEDVKRRMRTLLAEDPVVHTEYVSIAHAETLAELERIEAPALISLAARIGRARLIDNIVL